MLVESQRGHLRFSAADDGPVGEGATVDEECDGERDGEGDEPPKSTPLLIESFGLSPPIRTPAAASPSSS